MTDLDVISGPVLLIISCSRTSQLMDNLFLVFLLLCGGSNPILLGTVWELLWKCGADLFELEGGATFIPLKRLHGKFIPTFDIIQHENVLVV